MLSNDGRENAPAHVELGGQAHESWSRSSDQIIENLIRNRLVKRTLVTVRPDIQLEALEFYAFAIGNIIKVQSGKIGLTGFGTKTGEFGNLHTNQKIPFRMRVLERFQGYFRFARH